MNKELKDAKLTELARIIAEFDIKLEEINKMGFHGNFDAKRCRSTLTYTNTYNQLKDK